MKTYNMFVDGRFVARVSEFGLDKLRRLMSYKGISFDEVMSGLDCSVTVAVSEDLAAFDSAFCILQPPSR